MNRRQRRAIGATNRVPPLAIRLLKIDAEKREVREIRATMNPEVIRSIMGKPTWRQRIIGIEQGAQILLLGDATPQIEILRKLETNWTVTDAKGDRGPLCHGVGLVCGLAIDGSKAMSTPVDVAWLVERIEWEPVGEPRPAPQPTSHPIWSSETNKDFRVENPVKPEDKN
jgi:hypothetical protein